MRNLIGILILATATIAMNVQNAHALQIVYPKTQNSQINAASTFFIGNTKPNSTLTINDKVVKVWENGSFVEVVPLVEGENTIKIESKIENECDTVTYIIQKIKKSNIITPEPQTEDFPENEFIYSTIVKDNTPLRADPNDDAKRLTHLNHNTILMLNGKKGEYYRVSLSPAQNAWVKAENVVNYSTISGKLMASVSNVNTTDDKLYDYIKTTLSFPVPYKVTETDNGLMLEIYNIKESASDSKKLKTSNNIKTLAINTVLTDNISTYFIETNKKLWGYNAYYEDNVLVLKIRKAPDIDCTKPLNGITIALDAGHGGNDAGAIGPTGVKEKEINLDIAKKLKTTLENAGANVVMTRTEDVSTDLYDRVKTAQKSDALMMISLHANALADGADPYVKHGTSTYFYNKESIELAKTLRNQLIQDLGTKDDGVCCQSFVLTRPTTPLSVLVEVAYMIHPTEYSMLLDEKFRQNAADSITKAIETYILNSAKF